MKSADADTQMRVIDGLFQALPEWNDTAKLRGKLLTIRRAIADSGTDAPSTALCAAVADLEAALLQIQRADPLTRMIARVAAWHERLDDA